MPPKSYAQQRIYLRLSKIRGFSGFKINDVNDVIVSGDAILSAKNSENPLGGLGPTLT